MRLVLYLPRKGLLVHPWLRILESPDNQERVVIVRRLDGTFTYRRQWRSEFSDDADGGWGPLGPDCGIYDSEETAEIEAQQRIEWLRDRIP
jgi:hypothetical protein